MKNRPIYAGKIPEKMGATIDMKNYETKFIHKRTLIKDKDEFISYYEEHEWVQRLLQFCEIINPETITTRVISVETAI
jgi:hypothetical protein